MRNKKDLYLASSLEELETITKVPDKLKELNVVVYVQFNIN